MNTKARGRRYELKAKQELEAAHFKVEINQGKVLWIPDPKNPGRRMPITKRVDFFGAFDLIAAHAAYLRFIQVVSEKDTDGGDVAAKKRKIEALEGDFPKSVSLELWRWQIRRSTSFRNEIPNGWRKWRLVGGRWTELQEG